ncbi:hypothetical protein LWP59_34445 [Amycolatopsis acidiphila]|uniref:Uncharacterized protein n=1 Tax=Amycolatopsis acidiphila TaxID=715473 RepID=A0A558A0K9_9PSEU|nr:hypothetical protein [Amycolatopsis acidiphila]TVT17803.1 hypothetical protein FNH06_30175 [Amycolatopsis acidiphila]UIJ59107.1 hypothetical protein LWP59_34445 [Amycolatopsis acidiphila]GHG98130.1 hypothetical protein GCM10017788_78020 [Amycolatopsis acidiphila]
MSEVLDWNAKTIAEFRANEGRVGGTFEGSPVNPCMRFSLTRRSPSAFGTTRQARNGLGAATVPSKDDQAELVTGRERDHPATKRSQAGQSESAGGPGTTGRHGHPVFRIEPR